MAMGSGGINAGDVTYHVGADLSGLQAGIQQSQQMVQGFGTTLVQNSRAVGIGFTAMGAAMLAPLTLGVKSAYDFEKAITLAASKTGETGEAFESTKQKMTDMAMVLGRTTVFSATDAANAFNDLAGKGFDVVSMSAEELKPILDMAAATQEDLTKTTEVATSTLFAFGLEQSELGRVSDVMVAAINKGAATMDSLNNSFHYVAPVAKAAGLSIEDTAGYLDQLYQAGLDGSMAGTALRGVLMELMSPSDKLAGLLLNVGLKVDDVSLSSNSFEEALKTLSKSGLTAGDMLEVFGARAGPASLTLLETTDAAKKMGDELRNAGGIAEQTANQQLDTLWGQLKMLTSALEGLVIPIGQALIPALRSLVEFLTPIVSKVAEFAKEHEFLTTVVVGVTGAFGILFTTLGPLMIMLPGLVLFFKGLAAILGIGGVGTAATSAGTAITGVGTAAATAAGAGGVGALVTALAGVALPVGAGVAIGLEIGIIAAAAWEAVKAYTQLNESASKLYAADQRYMDSLKARGVVFDEVFAKSLDYNTRMAYLQQMESDQAAITAAAWFQHYASRSATEKEFANMKALMLNEEVTSREAAVMVIKGYVDDQLKTMIKASEEETDAMLRDLDIRTDEHISALNTITNEEMKAAQNLVMEWDKNSALIADQEAKQGEMVMGVWARAWQYIQSVFRASNDGLNQLSQNAALGNPNIPHNAAGGPAYANAPTLVGERGPELFVPRVDGRIMTHAQTAAAMAGGGGGNVTVNMNANIASNMDIDAVAKRLGDQLRQRFTGIGHHADWRRA